MSLTLSYAVFIHGSAERGNKFLLQLQLIRGGAFNQQIILKFIFYIKDHNGLPVKNNNKLNAIFLLYLCLSLPLALLLPSSPTPFKIFSCLPTHPTPFGIFSSPSTPPYPFEIIDCFSFKTGLLVEPRKAGSCQRQNFL